MVTATEGTKLVMVDVTKLHPNKDNPRKNLGDISELTESIKKNGVMQNLTVVCSEKKPDEYIVLIGHRRLAAAKAAGLTELPCKIIEKMDKKEQLGLMLEENMQRTDLTVREQAEGFQLMLDLGETVKSIAKKTGFSEGTIRHRVELAKLDKDVLKERSEGDSTQKTGRELFQLSLTDFFKLEKVDDLEKRNEILREATDGRELENMVQRYLREKKAEKNAEKLVKEFEEIGIVPATEEQRQNRYRIGRWLARVETDENTKIPKEYREKIEEAREESPDGKLWYVESTYYNGITYYEVYAAREETEQVETGYDRQRKRTKELDKLKKSLEKEIRALLLDIVEGNRKELSEKEQAEAVRFCWPIISNEYGRINYEGFCAVYGTNDVSKHKEEYEAYCEKAMWLQMLAFAAGNKRSIHGWDGSYRKDEAEELVRVVNFLHKLYGFSLDGELEELDQYLKGTHNLFKKDEKAEESAA